MARKFILLVALGAAAYYGYTYFTAGGAGTPQMGGAPPVSVAEVVEREVQTWQEFSGRLQAVDMAEIRPQVSGTIESIHFTDGAVVAKGDLLFVIDPRPYEAALQSARARAELANAEWKRAETLLAEKAISQRDYDQRKNNAAVARADLTRAQLNLDYTRVKAPIAGRVSRAEITVGNLVEAGPNAPLLTSVVASDPMYADFEIDEASYLRYARAKAIGGKDAREIPVTLQLAGGGEPRAGKVESFDNRLDTMSGTIRVRAVFDNEDGLLVPGLFARVSLGNAEKQKALLITDRAIGTDQNKKFVLVVKDDNSTERREVKLGGTADGLRIIEEGLNPGEKIIVSGLQRVMMPGQPVTPELVTMEPEGGAGKEQALNAPAVSDAEIKPAAGGTEPASAPGAQPEEAQQASPAGGEAKE